MLTSVNIAAAVQWKPPKLLIEFSIRLVLLATKFVTGFEICFLLVDNHVGHFQ